MRTLQVVFAASVLLLCGVAHAADDEWPPIRGDKTYVNKAFKQAVELWRDHLESSLRTATKTKFSSNPDFLKVEEARKLAAKAAEIDQHDAKATVNTGNVDLTSDIQEGANRGPLKNGNEWLVDEALTHKVLKGKDVLDEWKGFTNLCKKFDEKERSILQDEKYAWHLGDLSIFVRAMYADCYNREMKQFILETETTNAPKVSPADNEIFTFRDMPSCAGVKVCVIPDDMKEKRNFQDEEKKVKEKIDNNLKDLLCSLNKEAGCNTEAKKCLDEVKGVLNNGAVIKKGGDGGASAGAGASADAGAPETSADAGAPETSADAELNERYY